MAQYMIYFPNGWMEFACEGELDLTQEWAKGKDEKGRKVVVRVSEIRSIREVENDEM
jgi:hypothetical protein